MTMKVRQFLGVVWPAGLTIAVAMLLVGCGAQTLTSTPGPTPTLPAGAGNATDTPVTTPALGPTELKYMLLGKYASDTNLLYCDPDKFPLEVSPEEELKRAQAKLPEIQADKEKYEAILRHNNLGDTAPLTDDQTLLVYRESKKLDAIVLEPSGDKHNFVINVGAQPNVSEGAGTQYEGLIDSSGNVSDETHKDVNVRCPICLAGNTLISTPNGPLRVRGMSEGMSVWTLDKQGKRVAVTVLRTVKRNVAIPYQMVHLVLSDGRELYVSPRHPLTDGRSVGSLEVGATLDNARVVQAERVSYDEGATYDILPSGPTGYYWANGILLASTLTPNPPDRR